ncbi:unnamed protein product [Rangifer tarandus platyrhynchus]|uniref:Uncharacterized protein n=2 Tax=Rangifer tarandus platyrhynchus TaxID=3082113 RepID=A0ABN8Y866_RANTA|nr:unnamed protein product [Rangifer tarandus platyrhynchus]CAI9695964.1 unnamed protein product [Rangifer tarandus platyrhynchus]
MQPCLPLQDTLVAAPSELLGGCRVGSPPRESTGAASPLCAHPALQSSPSGPRGSWIRSLVLCVCVAPQPPGHEATGHQPSRSEPVNRSCRAPAQTQHQRVAKWYY